MLCSRSAQSREHEGDPSVGLWFVLRFPRRSPKSTGGDAEVAVGRAVKVHSMAVGAPAPSIPRGAFVWLNGFYSHIRPRIVHFSPTEFAYLFPACRYFS
jgi:hypothetical protein